MSQLSRRSFCSFLPALAVGLGFSGRPRDGSRVDPWRVRLVDRVQGQPPYFAHVADAVTGADVSRQFPIAAADRLVWSFERERPVLVELYRRDEHDHVFLDGDEIASRVAWVQVASMDWRQA